MAIHHCVSTEYTPRKPTASARKPIVSGDAEYDEGKTRSIRAGPMVK
jgi:hypothetical protein